MSLNNVPSSIRIHIGIFGRRNAGKSSLINAITNQNLAIVSDIKGTTTDPVLKSMELLPLGPVVIIDTPGFDDIGKLGSLRIEKTKQILNKTDIALLVLDATMPVQKEDLEIFHLIKEKEIPYIIVMNKCDLLDNQKVSYPSDFPRESILFVSAEKNLNIQELKEFIGRKALKTKGDSVLICDKISPNDFVLLVIPLDKASPKGRLILPQQQTIRDIMDHGGIPILTRDVELKDTLAKLLNQGIQPALIITDSQIFEMVASIVPKEIPLTSFSILFARYKGNLEDLVEGAKALDTLQDNDLVLISEGCTHHRQCGDIGTQKLPEFIKKHTQKNIRFAFTSGTEFPNDLSPYNMIIHCGGCMLNEREMKYRLKCAKDMHIPMTNYGIAIAHMKGILLRSIALFS